MNDLMPNETNDNEIVSMIDEFRDMVIEDACSKIVLLAVNEDNKIIILNSCEHPLDGLGILEMGKHLLMHKADEG